MTAPRLAELRAYANPPTEERLETPAGNPRDTARLVRKGSFDSMAESTAFRLTLAQFGPVHDPVWLTATETVKAALLRAAVVFGLEAKDKELAAGLDRFGAALAPIAPSTRKHRRSAMGPASPGAPPLEPALGLSRTRALLDGRALLSKGAIEFFWRYDDVTGEGWGRILAFHRSGGPHLPIRDVIGISPESIAETRTKVLAWWAAYKRAAAKMLPEKDSFQAAYNAVNRPGYGPKPPKFQPVGPAGPKPIKVVGRTDLENAVGGDLARAAASLQAGQHTGFRQFRTGEPPAPPAPARPPARPPAAPPAIPRPRPVPATVPMVPAPVPVVAEVIPPRPAAVKPLPTFGPSRAKFETGLPSNVVVKRKTREVLGREFTRAGLASIAGAPANARVSFEITNREVTVSWKLLNDAGQPYDPRENTARRTFRKNPDTGKVRVHNDVFLLPDNVPRGTGIGLEVFGRQIEALQNIGAEIIETYAYRMEPRWFGYAVWPKFGYDGPLPRNLREPLPPEFAHATTVQELRDMPGGETWWERNGESFNATFDLTPGSPHLRQWETYRRRKRAETSPTSTPTT